MLPVKSDDVSNQSILAPAVTVPLDVTDDGVDANAVIPVVVVTLPVIATVGVPVIETVPLVSDTGTVFVTTTDPLDIATVGVPEITVVPVPEATNVPVIPPDTVTVPDFTTTVPFPAVIACAFAPIERAMNAKNKIILFMV